MSERETDSLGEDGMSEEDQNRRRLERAGWTNGDLSLSLLLLLKKGLFLRWDAKFYHCDRKKKKKREKRGRKKNTNEMNDNYK